MTRFKLKPNILTSHHPTICANIANIANIASYSGANMSPLPHEELKKLLGMDDALWEQAGYLQDFLQMLNQQRRSNPNALRGAYPVAALSMYRYSFHSTGGRWYDEKRKCLWYLGSKVRSQPVWKCSTPLISFCNRDLKNPKILHSKSGISSTLRKKGNTSVFITTRMAIDRGAF
ncbi:hypothetical protein G7Y89_g9729 [Cudoniella acicularis]|uniref:Uncharacterized protein n=1 Tax=Cudoniella acicularis TaxID=354080 RepID=A0A8H4RE42_9HELO|nr:hypothetical protein G7Y89_g9729 [Cudoniella acicularis]